MKLLRTFLFVALTVWMAGCGADVTREADNLFRQGKYEEAIAAYDEYLATKPKDIKSLYNRGRAYEELGQLEKAKDDFIKVLNIDGDNLNANLSMGQYWYGKKDYNKALAFLDKVIVIDGRVSMAYLLKGRCYHQQGEFEEAKKNYDLAIEFDNENGEAFLYRGALKVALNQMKGACNDLNRARVLGAEEAGAALAKYCK